MENLLSFLVIFGFIVLIGLGAKYSLLKEDLKTLKDDLAASQLHIEQLERFWAAEITSLNTVQLAERIERLKNVVYEDPFDSANIKSRELEEQVLLASIDDDAERYRESKRMEFRKRKSEQNKVGKDCLRLSYQSHRRVLDLVEQLLNR